MTPRELEILDEAQKNIIRKNEDGFRSYLEWLLMEINKVEKNLSALKNRVNEASIDTYDPSIGSESFRIITHPTGTARNY